MPDPDADAAVRVGRRRPATRSRDWSSYGRDGLWAGGAATYLATGPTGTSAEHHRHALPAHAEHHARLPARGDLGGRDQDQRRPPPTAGSGTGRPPSGGDDVGFLIDLTPSGQVRIITSGRGVTTNAVPPTGRFINLVITAGRDGDARRLRRRRADRRRQPARPRHQRLRAGRAALRRRPGRRPAHQRRARPHGDVHQGRSSEPTARAGRRWRSSTAVGQHAGRRSAAPCRRSSRSRSRAPAPTSARSAGRDQRTTRRR